MSPAPAVGDVGQKLASAFLDLLPITGLAISVLDQADRASVVHASDDLAARLEEVHFDLGEGPLFECVATARPVLVPDVADADQWPMFLAHSHDMGADAVFVFPLTLGAVCVGGVLCYRVSPGALDTDDVEVGCALSRAIAGPAFRRAIVLASDEAPDGDAPIEMRREVHQATGMMLLQLETTATDAFARMRAHAFSTGVSLGQVARDVVARRLDFSAARDRIDMSDGAP